MFDVRFVLGNKKPLVVEVRVRIAELSKAALVVACIPTPYPVPAQLTYRPGI